MKLRLVLLPVLISFAAISFAAEDRLEPSSSGGDSELGVSGKAASQELLAEGKKPASESRYEQDDSDDCN